MMILVKKNSGDFKNKSSDYFVQITFTTLGDRNDFNNRLEEKSVKRRQN